MELTREEIIFKIENIGGLETCEIEIQLIQSQNGLGIVPNWELDIFNGKPEFCCFNFPESDLPVLCRFNVFNPFISLGILHTLPKSLNPIFYWVLISIGQSVNRLNFTLNFLDCHFAQLAFLFVFGQVGNDLNLRQVLQITVWVFRKELTNESVKVFQVGIQRLLLN